LYQDDVEVPDTFDDDYKNRAHAAAKAKMRIRDDLTYQDLGLVPLDLGEPTGRDGRERKVPNPTDPTGLELTDADTGEVFRFADREALGRFKYQRYIKRYLRTVASLDENVGRMLDWLDTSGLAEDTIVIYTSDQGFFLGEHGWFDKRFIYEQSFQMPFLIRYPSKVAAGAVCDDIVCNVDFAPMLLDFAGLPVPDYMQGRSFRRILEGQPVPDWPQIAYHRYWMHRDATHNVYAHYGVRDQRYKLIYWYNEGFNLPGTREGGQDREWEFFDLEADPLELFNLINDPLYRDPILDLYERLDNLQSEIGDTPEHSEPP
jgi:arylsulfatase A-like enzyme